jgi:hypothetical protein
MFGNLFEKGIELVALVRINLMKGKTPGTAKRVPEFSDLINGGCTGEGE